MNDFFRPLVVPLSDPDLLLRPMPGRNEGPQGYLLRLAEQNCMSLHELRQLGVRYDPVWLARNRLLPDESLDPDLHSHVTRMCQLVQDKGRVWNQRYARFCPLCLAEEPTWRASWELLFHDCCPHHGVWLVDQCSSCTEAVSWKRDHLLRCQCGSDLRQELPGAAPDSLCHLASVLEARLLDRDAINQSPVLAGMDLEQIQRLVRYLGGYLNPISGPKPLKLRNASSLQASWPISSLAAEILSHWPQAFHDCWSRMQDQVEGEKLGLKEVFRRAHFYLYKGLWESAFRPVRDSFEIWLSEHWKFGLSRRNRLAETLLANAQWVPAQAAANQIGVSPNKLRALVRAGLLEGQESVSTRGRRFMVVRRDQLEAVVAQLDNEITMTKALALLGIGKLRLRRILKLLFPSARRILETGSLLWAVPRNEVELLLVLADRLPVVTIPEEDQVTLAHVLRHWTWTTEQVATLIDAVKRGQVKLLSRWEGGKGITGWVFDKAQLKIWYAALTKGRVSWVSIPQIARTLGIKDEMAYWLCRNGYINSEKLGTRKEMGTRIRVEELERFQAEYVFGRDIAGTLHTSSRRAARILAEQGILPISGHTLIRPRMLVYKVTENLQTFISAYGGSPSPGFQLVS